MVASFKNGDILLVLSVTFALIEANPTTTPVPLKIVIDQIVGFSVLAIFTCVSLAITMLCLWAHGKCYKRNKTGDCCWCPRIDSPCSSIVFDERYFEDFDDSNADGSDGKVEGSHRIRQLSRHYHRQSMRLQSTSSSTPSSDDSDYMAQGSFGVDSLDGNMAYRDFLKQRALRQHNSFLAEKAEKASRLNPYALSAWKYLQKHRPNITIASSQPSQRPLTQPPKHVHKHHRHAKDTSTPSQQDLDTIQSIRRIRELNVKCNESRANIGVKMVVVGRFKVIPSATALADRTETPDEKEPLLVH